MKLLLGKQELAYTHARTHARTDARAHTHTHTHTHTHNRLTAFGPELPGTKTVCKQDAINVCSIEYLTTQIELMLLTFFQLLDRSQNYRIFNVRAIV